MNKRDLPDEDALMGSGEELPINVEDENASLVDLMEQII